MVDEAHLDRIECEECGQLLEEREGPCPKCGSTKRRFYVSAHDTVSTQESLKLVERDRSGVEKQTRIVRDKISGKTKRKTREVLVYDKTDPKVTRKFHHVEEINDEGEPEVVHHEEEEYAAKHRSRSTESTDSTDAT
jgi:hypothetical protein